MAELKVKLNWQKNFANVIKQPIINAANKALDRWAPKLLIRAQDLCPVDTGALQESHFVERVRDLEIEVGFEETSETRAKSKSKNHPDGFFYGRWYHELGYVPNGPTLRSAEKKWLELAWFTSVSELENLFAAELRKRRQG